MGIADKEINQFTAAMEQQFLAALNVYAFIDN